MNSDIIFTTYFSRDNGFSQHNSTVKPGQPAVNNNFKLIAGWYNTIKKHNLNGIIFHDNLSNQFIKKHTCKNIHFELWAESNRPSFNDERFYCYRSYLFKHPEIQRVICTDLFDVQFFGNPFKLFGKHGLYLGSERRKSKFQMNWLNKKLKQLNLPQLSKTEIIYNAGIIGGYRDPLIRLLGGIIEIFKHCPKKYNANTPAYLHYTNRICQDKIFTGHPLHNEFQSNKNNGAYIKHK